MTGTLTPTTDTTIPAHTLRLATTQDAASVAELIGQVWSTHFAYSVTDTDLSNFLSTALSPCKISLDIKNTYMRFLIPCSSSDTPHEEIIGVAQLVIGPTEPCLTLPNPVELRRLYIKDTYQGTGLARDLVEGVQDLGRKEGYKSIWLGAWEGNKRGLRFYDKFGFVIVGEHTFKVGQSVRKDWVMEKSL